MYDHPVSVRKETYRVNWCVLLQVNACVKKRASADISDINPHSW